MERNTCLVGLVPSELVSKNPVLCPSASPTSACHFPAEAMGPRTLLILLVATAWHGKSRIRALGGGGGERVVTRFLGKDSLNLCPSLGVPTLCFHLPTLYCGCVGVCFGKAVEGKVGMNGVEPAWPGLWISPSSDGDCPCVLNTSLFPQGSLVPTEQSTACCWGWWTRQNAPQTPLCTQIPQGSCYSADSDSIGLRCDLRFFMTSEFLGDASAAGPDLHWAERPRKPLMAPLALPAWDSQGELGRIWLGGIWRSNGPSLGSLGKRSEGEVRG